MSFQVREKITSLPPVSSDNNGSGLRHTLRSIFDPYGRLVWEKSPRGFVTYFEYDLTTSGLKRKIEDVNIAMAVTAGLNPPSGWSTPGGGGTSFRDPVSGGCGRSTIARDRARS
jgi:hypothetical protein